MYNNLRKCSCISTKVLGKLEIARCFGIKCYASVVDGCVEEEAGFEEITTSEARDSIMADFMKMIPGMDDAELVQQTACLRPLSADGMPIVDRVTGWDNLFVATGAGRKGILWSTGMAQAMFDLIDTGKAQVDGAEHLTLGRFS